MSLSTEEQTNYEKEEEATADNRCRLCGTEDARNLQISQSPNFERLVAKIVTVYPVFIYNGDPLPNTICKNCVYNVSYMFNDIQKILQVQKKYIETLRSTQPEHTYLKVIDSVSKGNETTREMVRTTLGVSIDKRIVQRAMLMDEVDMEKVKLKPNSYIDKKVEEEKPQTLNSLSFDFFEDKPYQTEKRVDSPTDSSSSSSEDEALDYDDDLVLSELKHLPHEESECPQCGIIYENPALLAAHRVEHLQLNLTKMFEKRLLEKDLRRGRLISEPDKKYLRCLNCWKVFIDNKGILNHWSDLECDYFCSLCGEEFPNNPKLLREHCLEAHGISYKSLKAQRELLAKREQSQCPVEDQVVGEEATETSIPTSKINEQRQTSPALPNPTKSYQSDIEVKKIIAAKVAKLAQMAKPQNSEIPRDSVIMNKPMNPVGNMLQSSSAMSFFSSKSPFDPNTCPICNQRFQNGKARNSHMRIHKPSFSYGEILLPPNATSDPYSIPDPPNNTPSWQTQNFYNPNKPKPPATITKPMNHQYSTLNHQQNSYHRPPPTPAMPTLSSQPPAFKGVRTKIVPQRENPNMAPPQSPIQSTIKVKSLNDLQNPNLPLNISHSRNNDYDQNYSSIKPEPIDEASQEDYMAPAFNENVNQNVDYTRSNSFANKNDAQYVKEEPEDMEVDVDVGVGVDSSVKEPEPPVQNKDNGITTSIGLAMTNMTAEPEDEEDDEDDEEDEEFAASLPTCEICKKCFLYDDDLRLHKQQIHHVAV